MTPQQFMKLNLASLSANTDSEGNANSDFEEITYKGDIYKAKIQEGKSFIFQNNEATKEIIADKEVSALNVIMSEPDRGDVVLYNIDRYYIADYIKVASGIYDIYMTDKRRAGV